MRSCARSKVAATKATRSPERFPIPAGPVRAPRTTRLIQVPLITFSSAVNHLRCDGNQIRCTVGESALGGPPGGRLLLPFRALFRGSSSRRTSELINPRSIRTSSNASRTDLGSILCMIFRSAIISSTESFSIPSHLDCASDPGMRARRQKALMAFCARHSGYCPSRHSLLKANRRGDAEATWPVRSLITWTRLGGGLYRSIHSRLLKVLGTST
jgi:hypothetical protein